MFDSFKEYVSDSVWTYPYLFGISALDVLFPLVPSETSVILAGVFAGTGDLFIVAVILAAAAGAVLGDNTSYWIGRTAGPWIVQRFFAGKRKERIDWAEAQIEERGPYLIVVGRFIPGGRTAVTLSAGLLSVVDQTVQPTQASLWLRPMSIKSPPQARPSNEANVS